MSGLEMVCLGVILAFLDGRSRDGPGLVLFIGVVLAIDGFYLALR